MENESVRIEELQQRNSKLEQRIASQQSAISLLLNHMADMDISLPPVETLPDIVLDSVDEALLQRLSTNKSRGTEDKIMSVLTTESGEKRLQSVGSNILDDYTADAIATIGSSWAHGASSDSEDGMSASRKTRNNNRIFSVHPSQRDDAYKHDGESEIMSDAGFSDTQSSLSRKNNGSDSRLADLVQKANGSVENVRQEMSDLLISSFSSGNAPTTTEDDSNHPHQQPVDIRVIGCAAKLNEKGREVLSFIISVNDVLTMSKWNIQKVYVDFVKLDHQLRLAIPKSRLNRLGKIPDKSIFSAANASKNDQKRLAIELYLGHVRSIVGDALQFVEFLCSDFVKTQQSSNSLVKRFLLSGYLLKKGKSFGGWKKRFYDLGDTGEALYYSEDRGSELLGAIDLRYCYVCKDNQPSSSTGNPQQTAASGKHAFVLTEYKKMFFAASNDNLERVSQLPESKMESRHVLYVDDEEVRNNWVRCLAGQIWLLRPNDKANVEELKRFEDVDSLQREMTTPSSALPPVSVLSKDLKRALSQDQLSLTSGDNSRNSTTDNASQSTHKQSTQASSARQILRSMMPSRLQYMSSSNSSSHQLKSSSKSLDNIPVTSLKNEDAIPNLAAASKSSKDLLITSSHAQSLSDALTDIGALIDSPSKHIDSSVSSAPPTDTPSIPPSFIATPIHTVPSSKSISSLHHVATAISIDRASMNDNERIIHQPEPNRIVDELPEVAELLRHKMFLLGNSSSGSTGSKERRKGGGGGANGSNSNLSAGNAGGRMFRDWVRKKNSNNELGQSSSTASIIDAVATAGGNSNTHKPVFGVSLQEAVANSRISDSIELPAIVFRCIEYLDAKKAEEEEGIYRLSGSSSVIQSLKQRFEQEGDVNIISESDTYFDIHAVTGLLKLFLRELGDSVLTNELRPKFFQIGERHDRNERITELKELMTHLPAANYNLLRVLIGHLIRIIQHSHTNKMSLRNISIVFSPTLGIPATIFTLMLSEYSIVMGVRVGEFVQLHKRIDSLDRGQTAGSVKSATGSHLVGNQTPSEAEKISMDSIGSTSTKDTN